MRAATPAPSEARAGAEEDEMSERFPTFGDNPIRHAHDDWLGRARHCAVIAGLVRRPSLDLPITLGIYGDWGSGKTSMMQLIRGQLGRDELVMSFNAWAYSQQSDALWRALLLALTAAFRDPAFQERLLDDRALEALLAGRDADVAQLRDELNEQLDRVETSMYRSKTYREREGVDFNSQAAVLLTLRAALRMLPIAGSALAESLQTQLAEGQDVKDLFGLLRVREREEVREQIQSVEQFRGEFQRLIRRYVDGAGRRLVVFIDDLDRCLPEQAVSVLEAIKIFFEAGDGGPLGCVFVLGMDRRVAEEGIRVRYAGLGGVPALDARSYLDKIIQIPFNVPPLSTPQVEAFVATWCRTHHPDLAPCAPLIAAGVAPNPRTVKRTLHILGLLRDLRAADGLDVSQQRLGLLTKLLVIQTSYDDVYRELITEPDLLRRLELASAGGSLPDTLARHGGLRDMLRLPPRLPADPAQAGALIADLLYFVAPAPPGG